MSEWIEWPLHANIFQKYKSEKLPSLFNLQNQINFNRPSQLIKSRRLKYHFQEDTRLPNNFHDSDASLYDITKFPTIPVSSIVDKACLY